MRKMFDMPPPPPDPPPPPTDRVEQAAREAGEARTAQAVAEAQNEALTRQLDHDIATERAHAQQRREEAVSLHHLAQVRASTSRIL